ncbi:flavin reductase family protein [Streptomyces sp. NPDC005799]|uniref:flavin reductase family protein n=1 Tax=Streptomyces sp. NPDC005799 TaxID=3154678 RepID=UPI0033E9F3F5
MTEAAGALESPTPSALPSVFREVMAAVCTPVSVVTAIREGRPHGTTVSAFASLSMNPPMILVSLDRSSELLAVIRESGAFGVNVLSSGQSALARQFATKGGAGKFTGVRWQVEARVPRLPDAGGFLACDAVRFVEGGDHVVLLGLVRAADTVSGPPLTYHARSFGTHTALEERSA